MFVAGIEGFGVGDAGLFGHAIGLALVVCPLDDVPGLGDEGVDAGEGYGVAGNELDRFVLHGKEDPLVKMVLLSDGEEEREKFGGIHLAGPAKAFDDVAREPG